MSGINFLQRDERDKKNADSLKAIILPITTAVMVVYLILLSSLLGWWWWWSSKQERVSVEYASLRGQVDSKQQSELLAKRMEDRVKVINTYLDKRKDIFRQSEFLVDKPYTVDEFGLDKEGYYFVRISATESATVAALEDDLKISFGSVMLKKMSWSYKDQLWSALYWYKDYKI